MSEVQFKAGEHGSGIFFIEEKGERIAFMTVHIHGSTLTAIHTAVPAEWSGQGLGGMLVDAMVAFARTNTLKVIPLCPYVRALFERRPERYADVWRNAS
jgi:uncharacterized protein